MDAAHEQLDEIAVEFLIDCSQPQLCDCVNCDLARRAKVQAFAERWEEQHYGAELSGVRATQTVRPPSLRKLKAVAG